MRLAPLSAPWLAAPMATLTTKLVTQYTAVIHAPVRVGVRQR